MNESSDLLSWLERWYQEQSDGEREHEHGFSIQTIDNPGWLLRANLRGMIPEEMATDRLLVVLGEPPSADNGNIGGEIWMTCKVESGHFVGAGDLTQLRAILTKFRSVVEEERV